MNNRFLITGLMSSIINLLLHGMAYSLILKDFFTSHPAGPEEFLNRFTARPKRW